MGWEWPRNGEKNFSPKIPFILDSGKKIPKKIAKKFKKLKNLFPALFIAKTGWDRPRKRKKKFYTRIPFILDPGKKIPKKIKKPHSGIISSQNGMRYSEKEKKKKILVPNSVHTRPRQENS